MASTKPGGYPRDRVAILSSTDHQQPGADPSHRRAVGQRHLRQGRDWIVEPAEPRQALAGEGFGDQDKAAVITAENRYELTDRQVAGEQFLCCRGSILSRRIATSVIAWQRTTG